MKCLEIRELSSEFIDGELDEKKASLIKQHIAKCVGCAQYYDELNHSIQLCNSLKPLALPDDFSQRLNEKLKTIKPITMASPWYKNKKMYIGAAGLAASIMLIAGPFYNSYLRSGEIIEPTTKPYSTDLPQIAQNENKAAVPLETPPPQSVSTPAPKEGMPKQTAPPNSNTDTNTAVIISNAPAEIPIQPEPANPPSISASTEGAEVVLPQSSVSEPVQKEPTPPPMAATQAPMVAALAPTATSVPETQMKATPEPMPTSSAYDTAAATESSDGSGGGGGGGTMFALKRVQLPTVLFIKPDSNISAFKEWVAKNITSASETKTGGYSIIAVNGSDFDKAINYANESNVKYIITSSADADLTAISNELTGENYIIIQN